MSKTSGSSDVSIENENIFLTTDDIAMKDIRAHTWSRGSNSRRVSAEQTMMRYDFGDHMQKLIPSKGKKK